LDDDYLIYIEGHRPEDQFDFVTKRECEEDYLELIADEVMSGGDN
jgi:hypothetical protein